MTTPGYTPGGERDWWWKVADHLDKAVIASVNAMVHNVDAQDQVFKLQDKLREAQTILLQIFQAKGLLPGSPTPNGANGHNGTAAEILVPEVVVGSNGVTSKEPIQDAEIVTADAPAGRCGDDRRGARSCRGACTDERSDERADSGIVMHDDLEEAIDKARSYVKSKILRGDPNVLACEFARALAQIADRCVIGRSCEKHSGVIHGHEAEGLRAGVEQIIDNTAAVRDYEASFVLRETRRSLIFLLDQIDAGDSLAFREATDPPTHKEANRR